ncbi:MAG: hypothetical protein Q8922_02885 [Bacteroidota bacterium]|nr:hypothetical protein [Bacteroidota bacterium]MDP4232911.1 hypothetical protein [Bacteroidota bacterium]MDP4241955.1 hypothetical protein [Bacteroidota bacterium]MDP4286858.1 hypothetical protein [Bacteroidota bacterium]
MAPLPQLPTDNLYKFLALAGVALVLVSGYLQIQAGIVEDRWERDITSKTQILANEVKAMSDTYNRDTAKADSAMLAQKPAWDLAVHRSDSILNEHLNEWWPWKLALETRVIDLWMWWIGWILTLGGFWLWYWKVQRFKDRKLKARTEARERKNVKAAFKNPKA